MPAKIGSVTIPCAEVALPLAPPDRFHVLDQEGMADQSTLFEVDRWDPFAWPIIITGASRKACLATFTQLRGLRRTKVEVADDDADKGTTLKKALICAVIPSPPTFAGVIVGGTNPTDTWEMQLVVVILPAAE